MEDNNFIKFGPEWLRNFATRPSRRPEGREGPSNQISRSSGASANPNSGTYSATSSGAIPRTGVTNRNISNSRSAPNARGTVPTRVSLAKLRYGREEMLALYDRNSRPTVELRQFEQIYKPRPRAPVALYNTFGATNFRDGTRPPGSHSSMDKYRGQPTGPGRGRGRAENARSWWRQNSVDGEWRNEPARARQPEREHGERPVGREKWNHRKYSQSDEEAIPEWARENVETKSVATGTFDSSGAFHGGSEDPRFQKEIEMPVRRIGYFKRDGSKPHPVYRYQPQNIPPRTPQAKPHTDVAPEMNYEDTTRSRDNKIKNYESGGAYNAMASMSSDVRPKVPGSEKPKEIKIFTRPKDDKGSASLDMFKQAEKPRRILEVPPKALLQEITEASPVVNETNKAATVDNIETKEVGAIGQDIPNVEENKPNVVNNLPIIDKEQSIENVKGTEEPVSDSQTQQNDCSNIDEKVIDSPVKKEDKPLVVNTLDAKMENELCSVENTKELKDDIDLKSKDGQPLTFEKYQQEQIMAMQSSLSIPPPMTSNSQPSINPNSQTPDSQLTQMEINAMYKHTGAIPKVRKNINTEYNSTQNTTYANLMRMPEAPNDDSGHFKSVMIAPTNSLRQKHQNMVSSNEDPLTLSSLLSISSDMERGHMDSHKLDYGLFNMNLESTDSPLLNPPPSMPLYGLPQNMNIPMMPMSGMQNSMLCNPGYPNAAMTNQATMNPDMFGMPNQNISRDKQQSLGSMPMSGFPNPNMNNQNSGFPGNAFQAPYSQGIEKPSFPPQFGSTLPNMPTSRAPLLPLQNAAAICNTSLNEILSKMRSNSFMNTQQSPPYIPGLNAHQNMPGNQMPNLPNFNPNMYNLPHNPTNSGAHRLDDAWLYEDPSGEIQGPFSNEAMWEWHQSGFFNPEMLIRNVNDLNLRPLWSYGTIPPYAPISLPKKKVPDMVGAETATALDSVWGQAPPPRQNMDAWSQRPTDFFDMKPSVWDRSSNNNNNNNMVSPKSMIPDDITKEMKTEDQILAAIRGNHHNLSAFGTGQNMVFQNTELSNPTMDRLEAALSDFGINTKPKTDFIKREMIIPNMDKTPAISQLPTTMDLSMDLKPNPPPLMLPPNMQFLTPPPKLPAHIENKAKELKDANKTKNKNKTKDEKKTENLELRAKYEEIIQDKMDDTPWLKVKKEERKKKEVMNEYELKDWTLPTTNKPRKPAPNSKESKRLIEEMKLQQEYEYNRKQDEMRQMLILEDFQIKKDPRHHIHGPLVDSTKRVPWSGRVNPQQPARNEGLNLLEIQKLERERKIEQLKEQRLMMQQIAQKQTEAIQREQEIQAAGMVWSGKKNVFMGPVGGSNYDEYHALSRRNQIMPIPMPMPVPMPPNPLDVINQNIWSPLDPDGFWLPEQKKAAEKLEKLLKKEKLAETNKAKTPEPVTPKPKKKPTVVVPQQHPQPPQKRSSPTEEFEAWCADYLAPWTGQVDIPTFFGFLKDIESPYEVKDYVKVYLGDTKESNEFGRQFIERRSKILRAAMAAPEDDLGCPAAAINPRSMSGGDHDAKNKAKKNKKNKMVKIDASILGFSVTASNERFNVGDIDTA